MCSPLPLQVLLRAADRRFGAAAVILYVGVFRQVRRYLREGELSGRRLGGQWFIDRGDAEAFLLRRREGSDFERRLSFSDPDPLRDVIAIGGSGGGDIAAGRSAYLRSLGGDSLG